MGKGGFGFVCKGEIQVGTVRKGVGHGVWSMMMHWARELGLVFVCTDTSMHGEEGGGAGGVTGVWSRLETYVCK